MTKIRVAMLSFAHMHAVSYLAALTEIPEVEIVGIYHEDRFRGTEIATKHNLRYYSDYRQLLDEAPDAVVVCSANARHAELTIAAAEAGAHVLCEKPLATTVEDAKAMIAACRKNGVILQTAFPMRFSEPVKRAKQLIEEGKLGKILAIAGTNHGSMPPGWFLDRKLAGGGAVMDHTVHVADLMRWMLKDECTAVYAEADTLLHDVDIDDCGLLSMEFAKGTIATLDASWSRPRSFPTWGDVTMRIVGEKGTMVLDAYGQSGTVYSNKSDRAEFVYFGDNPDAALVDSFINAVKTGSPPAVTGEDGLRALEIALAAYQSSASGEVVTVAPTTA